MFQDVLQELCRISFHSIKKLHDYYFEGSLIGEVEEAREPTTITERIQGPIKVPIISFFSVTTKYTTELKWLLQWLLYSSASLSGVLLCHICVKLFLVIILPIIPPCYLLYFSLQYSHTFHTISDIAYDFTTTVIHFLFIYLGVGMI